MKVAIQNNMKETSVKVAKELTERLLKENIEINQVNPDILITIGGDGDRKSTRLNSSH